MECEGLDESFDGIVERFLGCRCLSLPFYLIAVYWRFLQVECEDFYEFVC